MRRIGYWIKEGIVMVVLGVVIFFESIGEEVGKRLRERDS